MSILKRSGESKKKWIRLVGLLIFILLLSLMDYERLFHLLGNARFGYLLAGLLLVPLSIAVKAFRWTTLLKKQGIPLPALKGFKYYAAGLFLGLITPGRAGDFGKIFYLRQLGYSYGKSALSMVLDRVLDISVLFLIAAFGAVLLLNDQRNVYAPLLIAFLAIVSLILILAIGRDFIKERLSAISEIIIPGPLRERFKEETYDFLADIHVFGGKGAVSIVIQTVLFWFIYMGIYFLMSKAVRADMSHLQLTTAVSMSAVISLLPISIAGIGTRDAFLIFIFDQWGIGKEKALLFSFCFLAFYFVSSCIGYLCFHLEPIAVEKGT